MSILNQLKTLFNPSHFLGQFNDEIYGLKSINQEVGNNDLCWCSDKNKEECLKITSGYLVLSNLTYEWLETTEKVRPNVNYIVVENPRSAFLKIASLFDEKIVFGQLGQNTTIDSSVTIALDKCNIGNNVTIEKDCIIGKNVTIKHNTVILKNTIVGDNVIIGANNTIGGVGFGYEKNEQGIYDFIPHLGNVEIKSNVEIGNNTCIDRAVIGSTIISSGVKIDNLVHIAHGVVIGENSLIIANAMIGGSTVIEKDCWVAPSSSLMQKINIGAGSIIGLSAVVLKSIEPNSVVVGNPAKKINK